MNDITIPFNKPHLTHKEIGYINHAHSMGKLAGDGHYTKLCHEWIEQHIGGKKALLTHSCTGALEMMALLSDIKPGEEVIMPSFTFVSTANAYVLRGAVPVFIDIREDTLNMDEKLIEQAITEKTRVLSPVHYAGVGCEMDVINKIAKKHNLLVVEDAAQGFLSKYKGKNLGTLGHMSAFSFHETKNVISGEGGALLINDDRFIERAEIIREKGTNRAKFFRGQVDKYTWVDVGSSYLPGEIISAFLMAQLENAEEINKRRIAVWNTYHTALADLEKKGYLRLPIIPDTCEHNGHMYYILTQDVKTRTKLIEFLKKKGILSVFHYIPLHSSPAGKKYTRYVGDMSVTDKVSDTLVRLPLFYNLTDEEQANVIAALYQFFTGKKHE